MVFFNYALRKLNAKIVYYGPGLCGKTTNLQWIHDHFEGGQRGRMISLATEGDRTIFFDLLPLDIGTIRGMQVTLQLYTVPGQVHYNSTRQLVLKGADGVVFVADSQRAMLKSNQDSWRNLQENLLLQGVELRAFPHVLQFNKRDLRDIMSAEDLDAFLNQYDCPIFEAVATDGVGVQETLEGIVKLVMRNLKERYEPVPAGAPGPPQPATGFGSTPWPAIGAPGAGRPAGPAATSPASGSMSHPLDVDTDTVGVTTREMPSSTAPPEVQERVEEPPGHADETPTLVSEAESLEEAEIVVPTAVPEFDREQEGPDTATGPELFAEAGAEPVGPPVEHAPEEALADDPTAVTEPDAWDEPGVIDDRWPDDDAALDAESEAAARFERYESSEPFAAGPDEDLVPADEPPFVPAPADEEELEQVAAEDADFELENGEPVGVLDEQPQGAWSSERDEWSGRPPTEAREYDEDEEIEPEFDVVSGEGEASGFVAPEPEEVAPPPPPRPRWDPQERLMAEVRSGTPSRRDPGVPFFVSDAEPFDEPFEILHDEPSTTHEIQAEASALVVRPEAHVNSVDVDPTSNQLHVRLHGRGALAEYGQVRELDITVPVPGQWIGNRRVTLQLRLTLTPAAEDEHGGEGGAS